MEFSVFFYPNMSGAKRILTRMQKDDAEAEQTLEAQRIIEEAEKK